MSNLDGTNPFIIVLLFGYGGYLPQLDSRSIQNSKRSSILSIPA